MRDSYVREEPSGISDVSWPNPDEKIAVGTCEVAATETPRTMGRHRPQLFGTALASVQEMCRAVMTA